MRLRRLRHNFRIAHQSSSFGFTVVFGSALNALGRRAPTGVVDIPSPSDTVV